MSRTKHNSKGPGFDYWGRQSYVGRRWFPFPGRITKKMTSRRRRRTDRLALEVPPRKK